jgi:hypothetical protein
MLCLDPPLREASAFVMGRPGNVKTGKENRGNPAAAELSRSLEMCFQANIHGVSGEIPMASGFPRQPYEEIRFQSLERA